MVSHKLQHLVQSNLKNKERDKFNKQEWKKLGVEREYIDFYADWEVDEILKKLLNIILKDEQSFYEFIEYMKNEMTENEYSTLSEISDEIACEYPSLEFIEAYKMLREKYPEETEKYHIADFIRDAEQSVRYSISEGRTIY